MRILAIVGSIRDGNSKILVDETVREIQKYDNVQIEKIHLKDISMRFCNGCLVCDSTGKCVFDDDMSGIISKVRDADAFIFATPARWRLLSGEMKTFLDRLNPLAVNEELKNKKAVVFAVGQSDEEANESIRHAAESLKMFCEDAGIKIIDTVIASGCYDKNDVQNKPNYINSCKLAANHLINSLKTEL